MRMKGRKNDKIMGPLFPRLRINDSERGGPRAPPRNKMALYEQLSIPSQKCSTGQASLLPCPPNNGSLLVPPASSSQGGRHEKTVLSSFSVPPPTPAHLSNKLHSGSSHAVDLNMTMGDFERKSMKNANYPSPNDSKHLSWDAGYGSFLPHDFSNSNNSCLPKVGDNDDLSVPAIIHSKITQSSSKYPQSIDRERDAQSIPSRPGCSEVILGNNMPKTAANSFSSSVQLRNAREKHLKRTNTTDLTSIQHGRNHSEENLKEFSSNEEMQKLASDSSTKENTSEPSKHRNASLKQDHESDPVKDIDVEVNIDARKHQEYKAGFLLKNTACGNGISADLEKINISRGDSESCSRASFLNGHRSPNEAENGRNYFNEKACRSLQVRNVDRNDDSSESMVDSISGLEISPDDVVGAIGQKQFWNTRRAILNQQRLFAVQVFELHRLIKVQRLIAGSPHLLLEDDPYFSKPSLEVSSAKKLPAEYVLKSPPKIEVEDESQKPNQSFDSAIVKPPNPSPPKIKAKEESQKQNQGPDSAVVKPPDPSPLKIKAKEESQKQNQGPDSAVVKPSDPSPPKIMAKDELKKPNQDPDSAEVKPPDPSPSDDLNKGLAPQYSSYGPYAGNLPPPPVATENKAGPPWSFHTPPGRQWVLPIMSPSEGLVHKLYTGAFPLTTGFMAPIYGGWGPMPLSSVAGGCLDPAFGFPGVSIFSGASPVAQAYQPVVNAVNSASPFEKGSSLAGALPDRQAEQLSTGEANFSMKSGSLSNILNQNDETISFVKKTQTSINGEFQETTMTSPCERAAQGVTSIPVSERKDEFTLFPMTPALVVSERVPQNENSNQQTPVIRVVPHNSRTAPESAARIFRFIQEERQQQYVPV